MGFEINQALAHVVEREGSDLHIKADSPPVARVHGDLWALRGSETLAASDTESALREIVSPELLAEFEENGEADFSYELPGVSRFRVNAFRQRGSVSIALRAIPFQVRTIDDLGLPGVVRRLAEEPRGILLLTGTTGSGKSTTLAAMIDHINSTRARHIVTMEDRSSTSPGQALDHQPAQVGSDTKSFPQAMRRVLRQDPDVILIGEMRDEETRTPCRRLRPATSSCRRSTPSTPARRSTDHRLLPPHLQQARVMLASTLKGAISQRLVPRIDREAGRRLRGDGRHRADPGSDPEPGGDRADHRGDLQGDFYGMQTFDQALLGYVTRVVSEEVAMETASSPHDFKLMLAAGASGRAESNRSSATATESPWELSSVEAGDQQQPDRSGGRPGGLAVSSGCSS
jgi:twitching motility protein PilT